MKRKFKLFGLVALVGILFSFVSCDNREKREWDENGEIVSKGTLSMATINFDINVDFNDVQKKSSSENVDINKFIVRIISTKNSEEVYRWLKADMPNEISLRTGKYRIEVFYPENPVDGEWSQPAYYGSRDFIIEDGKTSNIGDVVCRASNVKVSVVYKPVFTDQMKEYSVKVANAKGVKTFNETESRSAYFSTGALLATVTGKRNDGQSFSQIISITKSVAGDHHIITVDAQMIGTGTVDISIETTTNDKIVDVVILDDEAIIDPDPTPDPDPEPEPDVKLPTVSGVGFNIADKINHKQGEAREVVVKITAEDGGIKNLNVTINSPSLQPLLDNMDIPKSFDLANLSPAHHKIFKDLGLIGDEAVKDKKEFTFAISSFMELLPGGNQTHKFDVSVKDATGKSAKASLTIFVE